MIDYLYKKLIYHKWIRLEPYILNIDKYISNNWTKEDIKRYIKYITIAGKIYYFDKFFLLGLLNKLL